MKQLNEVTRERELQAQYKLLLENYNKKLTEFRDVIIAESEKESANTLIMMRSKVLFENLLSYITIIYDVKKNPRKFINNVTAYKIKMLEKIFPLFDLAINLLKADKQSMKKNSNELLTYVSANLVPQPNVIKGVERALRDITASAIILGMAALAFMMAAGIFLPCPPIGIIIVLCACSTILAGGGVGMLFGGITDSITIGCDIDKNRDTLYQNVITFNGTFFSQQDEQQEKFNQKGFLLSEVNALPRQLVS